VVCLRLRYPLHEKYRQHDIYECHVTKDLDRGLNLTEQALWLLVVGVHTAVDLVEEFVAQSPKPVSENADDGARNYEEERGNHRRAYRREDDEPHDTHANAIYSKRTLEVVRIIKPISSDFQGFRNAWSKYDKIVHLLENA